MQFKLVFEKSGDDIPFISQCPDLLEYYLDFANVNQFNKFNLIKADEKKITKHLDHLYNILNQFNQSIGSDFTGTFDIPDDKEKLLDQEILNQLHCKWVHSNYCYTSFEKIKDLNTHNQYNELLDQLPDSENKIPASEILYKYSLKELHDQVNVAIHKLEHFFNEIQFQGDYDKNYNWMEVKNIFDKTYTSNSRGNLQIGFCHYGRTLYNKFLYQSTVFHDDENTFDQLLGFLNLSLLPAETILYSKEYLDWCKQIDKHPGGENLNIGNIPDLSNNLLSYRQILYRNLINKDKFSLVI